jgi:hypothetical protein
MLHPYPVRCRIIEVAEGEERFGIPIRTPDESKPHIGKEGLAELIDDGGRVRVTLDDGTILYGEDCWWMSLEKEDQ